MKRRMTASQRASHNAHLAHAKHGGQHMTSKARAAQTERLDARLRAELDEMKGRPATDAEWEEARPHLRSAYYSRLRTGRAS